LKSLEDVARARERRDDLVGRAVGVPARVIEVQVRVDDERDLVRPHAAARELAEETWRLVDAEVALLLLIELRAGSGLDEHDVRAVADEQAVHVHGHTVQLIRRLLLLPQHLRHDAEHRPAIEAEDAVAEDLHLEAPDLHGSQYGETWRCATSARVTARRCERSGRRAASRSDRVTTTRRSRDSRRAIPAHSCWR